MWRKTARCTIAEKILQTFHLFFRRDRTRISQFIEHNSSEHFFPITFIRNRASLAWRRIDFWGSVYVKPSASNFGFFYRRAWAGWYWSCDKKEKFLSLSTPLERFYTSLVYILFSYDICARTCTEPQTQYSEIILITLKKEIWIW